MRRQQQVVQCVRVESDRVVVREYYFRRAAVAAVAGARELCKKTLYITR